MNTFIKRSMKLAVAIVFIGASVVPACAQKKGIIKGAKAALGKKPPLTGTAPVVKPVTPRVPPTLQGAQVPNFTTSVNKALDNAVERTVANKQLTDETATTKPMLYTKNVIQKVQETNLADLLRATKMWHKNREIKWVNEEFLDKTIDFRMLITPNTPKLIPITNIETDISYLLDAADRRACPFWRSFPATGKRWDLLVETLKKVDQTFFVEYDGQMYLDVSALALVHSYEDALDKLAWRVDSKYLTNILWNAAYFIAVRNKEIANALKAANNIGAPQFKGIPQADVTTQRTAEEIKSLVENLDPENPLRQAVEKMLKTAEDDGYITPIEGNPIH